MAGAFSRRDGRLFFVGLGLWAAARAAVSTTWRDPAIVGQLNAAGLIAIGIAIACVAALVVLTVRPRGTVDETGAADSGSDLGWPDPETRPRF
jgi:hypothetical protein